MVGSAPHMRGIPCNVPCSPRSTRISPAHAGNTLLPRFLPSATEDQPRTCGEYAVELINRGHQIRISPAHAGNTILGVSGRCWRPDQPRTCGEYNPDKVLDLLAAGSAPHMRGILTGRSAMSVAVGISPAHAGNTNGRAARKPLTRDQPRTCGEYAPRAWAGL